MPEMTPSYYAPTGGLPGQTDLTTDRAVFTEAYAVGVLFVLEGGCTLTIAGDKHELAPGGYAFLPPGCNWTLHNNTTEAARFHWIRKAYERVEGIDVPE